MTPRHMGLSTESIGDALAFILQGIPALSPDATDFIRKSPREARHAIAVALEAAAAQYAMGFSRGVPDQLRWYVARRNADDYMLGIRRAASRLEVSRATVYAWIDQKRLLAWRSKPHGLTIPSSQILGPRWVVPRLADVIGIVGSTELAWGFLTRNREFEDGAAPPLDLLKSGRADEVIRAASEFRAELP